jgi:hypothetical protein
MSDEHTSLTLQLHETRALREKFVSPIYLRLLHANFARNEIEGSNDARARIAEAARTISDEEILKLLRTPEWRGRLVAGWCIGLSGRTHFVDEIAELLLASELGYSGQGYCVALGLIGDEKSRMYLRDYLRKYLPLNGRWYDQLWAIGALAKLEGKPPVEFLDPELWIENDGSLNPINGIREFRQLVKFLTVHKMQTGDQ